MSQGYRWCFTLNNYVEAELVALRESLSSAQVRFAIFGKEVGETGTPHLQGYVSFAKKKRFAAAKAFLNVRAHVEVAKGDEDSNVVYCSKSDPNPELFGKRSQSGKRNDLDLFKEDVKSGIVDMNVLMESHSEVCARYPRFVRDYVRMQLPKPEFPVHPLRQWQQDLNGMLNHEPDDRKVIFVVDYDGNQGKSWFAKYYMSLHDNAFLMRPGKHADMAYILPDVVRVLFIDATRKQLEFFPYTFLEECKDGLVFSSKYESVIKKYNKMHVVCLMNQDPDPTALSADRYHVIKLE